MRQTTVSQGSKESQIELQSCSRRFRYFKRISVQRVVSPSHFDCVARHKCIAREQARGMYPQVGDMVQCSEAYQQTVGKIALNFRLNQGQANGLLNNQSLKNIHFFSLYRPRNLLHREKGQQETKLYEVCETFNIDTEVCERS